MHPFAPQCGPTSITTTNGDSQFPTSHALQPSTSCAPPVSRRALFGVASAPRPSLIPQRSAPSPPRAAQPTSITTIQDSRAEQGAASEAKGAQEHVYHRVQVPSPGSISTEPQCPMLPHQGLAFSPPRHSLAASAHSPSYAQVAASKPVKAHAPSSSPPRLAPAPLLSPTNTKWSNPHPSIPRPSGSVLSSLPQVGVVILATARIETIPPLVTPQKPPRRAAMAGAYEHD